MHCSVSLCGQISLNSDELPMSKGTFVQDSSRSAGRLTVHGREVGSSASEREILVSMVPCFNSDSSGSDRDSLGSEISRRASMPYSY